MNLRRAYSGYKTANLRPMVPLSLSATVAVYLVAVSAGAWMLAPALRFVPALPLLLFAFLAYRSEQERALRAIALFSVFFTEVAINLAGLGLARGLAWAIPGSLLLPVVTAVFWPTRRDFLAAMTLAALGPLPMMMARGDGLQQLQFAVYMSVAVTLAAMMYAVMEKTLRRQLQLEMQLRQQATFDGLTGVLRRDRFLDQAQHALDHQLARHKPVCMAYLDADHFKSLNDQFGHAAGDAALLGLADCLRSHVRGEDLIGRVGGEEFAILLVDLELHAARARMEQMREAVRRVRRPDGPLTISIGIAQSHGRDEAVFDLLVRADNAMRRAKMAGRDRAVLDETLH